MKIARISGASCAILITGVFVATVVGAGCTPDATPAAATEPPEALSVFYTCDMRGHISPCNCVQGVAGGIARRKTYLDSKRTADAILVDAGDVTAGPREWEILELEYILKGYAAMGYDAVNVGAREASLSAEQLCTLRDGHAFLISANVRDEAGERIFPAFRVKTLSNGYRVGIVGIVESTIPPDELGAGVQVTAPAEALAEVLPEVTKASDLIVLLAFVDETSMKALAERFFEVDLIIGGDVEQPTGTPLQVNRSHIAYVTDKGKSVGWLDLRFVDGQAVVADSSTTLLLEDVPDDPAMAKLVDELRLKQVERNYPIEKDDEEGLSRVSSGG
ncbi:MAG: hypothetical protein IT365_19945 [Candidatus Hydrogenedentes bacterium]|nr:hypothetical protein [Candidatus Hydrogenedentota bacterium]